MNIRKNAESIFVAAALIAMVTTFATAKTPSFNAAKRVAVVADTKLPTVVVSHKRLTAAEKAALN
ncbi:hypothetical protein [Massilia sp. TS11]|uniref:hypothetical protein n=1 Tax=Massilia sp. TS11 TaxID=2908003 RepID=UPI001EDB9EFB|nr:hypothetical protein [Massilia sp. TS11]MCG2584367.1 hypothetical protein [Massilia sp. TS11]